MSEPERAGVRADIQGGQGSQVGAGLQLNMFMGATPAAGATTPVVAGEIPQEPLAFQAREEILAVLRSGGPGVQVVAAVTGLRGVGKTQLAAAFARECVAARWRLVGWVDSEEKASVLAGLAMVATRLGIADGLGAGDAALAVRNWLEADGSLCLLVFDNVSDLRTVRRYIPAVGKARVVVTTAGQATGVRASVLPLGVFSEADGQAFLAERTGLDDVDGALAIGVELGWLPLGLAQAGAVIAAQRLSYPVYLERLRQVPVDEYLVTDPNDAYPRGVAEAVLLSLDAAADAISVGEACRVLLDLVSVLSPSGVSRSLLHAASESGVLPGCTGAWLVDEAAGRLADGSLLTFSGDHNSVSAHRLVMRVVRERARKEGTLAALGMRACGLLDEVMKSGEPPRQHRTVARDLIGQVLSLHEHLLPCLASSPDLEMALLEVRRRVLYWLLELGDAAKLAVAVGRAVLGDCARVLGKDHPSTLMSRNSLAYAYRAAGRVNEAIPLLEAAVADSVRARGEADLDTLACRNNLALAYQDGGRVGEAIVLYESVLAGRARVLGEFHRDTLTSRNNLALARHRAADRAGEAIPLLEAAVADSARVLGEAHPETLGCRNNLALAYQDGGRVGEAIVLYESVLAGRARVLGEFHPDTLTSLSNLALAYQDAGRVGEAVPLLESALAGRVRMLGEDHPSTLTSRNNLAHAYRAAGRAGEAISRYESVLADCVRALGEDDPSTHTSRDNLAAAYWDAGRLDEAIALLEATFAGRARALGEDHSHTLMSRDNLAAARQEAARVGRQPTGHALNE